MSEETRVSFRWDPLVDVYRPLAFHLGVLWSCDFFFFFFSFSLFSFLFFLLGGRLFGGLASLAAG